MPRLAARRAGRRDRAHASAPTALREVARSDCPAGECSPTTSARRSRDRRLGPRRRRPRRPGRRRQDHRDARAPPRLGAEHGGGSVVGLAPSAAAAHVLADDLGIATENLAKWWHDHQAHGETFRPGQLVIVDEASLAGTLPLDRVTTLAAAAGAKVLLVGDWAQLQSVDAGGAFAMLVHARRDAPELVDVHRFLHEWEKAASLGLRRGDPESVDRYLAHDRVREGDTDAMADAAYLAWRADARAGRATVLISDSNEAVAALNQRARADSSSPAASTRSARSPCTTAPGRGRRHRHHPAQRPPAARGATLGAQRRPVDGPRRASRRVARGATARPPRGSTVVLPAGTSGSTSTSATPSPPTAPRASRPTPRTSSPRPARPARTSTSR